MTTHVVCGDCGRMIEFYRDGHEYHEVEDTCGACERERMEAEYDEARYALDHEDR